MEPEDVTPPGLYARLLGSRWDELADAVRKLHSPGMIVHAAGVFRVRRGTNYLFDAFPRQENAGDTHVLA